MGGLPADASTDGDQASRFQSAQAVTDIALIPSQRLHQVEMSRANATLGAFVLRPHEVENVALQFRKQRATMRCLFHKAQAERWGLDPSLRLSGMGAEPRRWS
jgi:hypothetical protein